ncbi:MAG: hypothetical protein H6839_14660 [Planctomycetes bacterium]|nr:hypothetical protein [Planctomycetota bacterium]
MSSQLLGMAFAKVAASRVLSIRWLAQVDKMKAQGALTTTAGSNQRGDLVGHDDASKWHVIEAKGRSDPYAISVVAHAKTQASKVTSVEGQVPETTSACITSLHAKPISVLLDDPAADDKEDEAWEVDRERFFEVYYEGIIRALNEFKPRVIRTPRGVDFRVIKLRRILGRFADYIHPNLEFGLMEALYQSPQNAFEILNDYRVERDLKESIAGDGTALIGSSSRWEGE